MDLYRKIPTLRCFGQGYVEKYNYDEYRKWVDSGYDPSTYKEYTPVSASDVFVGETLTRASNQAVDHLLDCGTVFCNWNTGQIFHVIYTPEQLACVVKMCNGIAVNQSDCEKAGVGIAHILAFARFVELDEAPSQIPHTKHISL